MRGPDIAMYSVGDQCRGKGNKKEIAAVVQQVRKMTPGSRALTDFRDSMEWGRGDIYCGNHGWARGEKSGDGGARRSRSTQGHQPKYCPTFLYGANIKLATFESLAAALSILMEES